jgi:Hg(II)-responsive transcriptional regulator
MATTTALRTGELAQRAGVHVETLRFYERKGLLPEPPRRASGYREYPPDTVDRVRFIKRAQELGFSLREVKELLSMRQVPRAKADVRRLAQARLAEIEHKIRDLEAMRKTLNELLCACDSRNIASCPIIESLSGCPKCQEANRGTQGTDARRPREPW